MVPSSSAAAQFITIRLNALYTTWFINQLVQSRQMSSEISALYGEVYRWMGEGGGGGGGNMKILLN